MSFAEKITIEQLETDPYPIYAYLRKYAPVAYVPTVNSWFVTRWQDVNYMTKAVELFSAEDPNSPVCSHFGMPAIIHADGDVHRELRMGVAPHYAPNQVDAYIEELVVPIAREFLQHFLHKGKAELMSEYFEPISVLSLARSFGLKDIDVPTLRHWFAGLSQGAINFERDPDRKAICDGVIAEIDEALAPLLTRLEQKPDDSVLSNMMYHGRSETNPRSRSFIMPSVRVTLLGGMQEPGHGAGSTLVGLLQNPDQMTLLLSDMDTFIPKAVNEGVRWMAPIGTQVRTPVSDIELAGVSIPEGASVAALISSAGRDETIYDDPDSFNIAREAQNKHMASFGFGPHFCAGKWFSMAQMELTLRILLEEVDNLALDHAQLPKFNGWEFRAPTALHVTFDQKERYHNTGIQ